MNKILMVPGADAIEDSALRAQSLKLGFIQSEINMAQKLLDQNHIPVNLNKFMTEANEKSAEWFHHLAVATVVVQVALYHEYVRQNGKPDVVLSCSLGDVARNVFLKAVSYETSLIYMYEFVKSVTQNREGVSCHVTSAQPISAEQIELLQKFDLEISVFQTPQHMLVGGTPENIKKWAAAAGSAGDMKLKMIYPFPLHTKLMEKSRLLLSGAVASTPILNWQDVRVYSPISKKWLATSVDLKEDILCNIVQTVNWQQSVFHLVSELKQVEFISLGPAPTLVQFHHRTLGDAIQVSDFFTGLFDAKTFAEEGLCPQQIA